ncbi:MAG: M20/M25/M40 family metallo-hydrolase [Longimicrobiales bacterium]
MRHRLPRIVGAGMAIAATTAFVPQDPVADALATISAFQMRAHLSFLSHDLLEGRGTGSRGGRIAATYIASELMRAGVQPVGPRYLHDVPIIGVTPDGEGISFVLSAEGRRVAARYTEDVVVWPGGAETTPAVSGELVFVGYGVHAPESGWDDFDDVDLRGRILLVLVGDPPAPPDDPDRFDGPAMTYYGRWTYKFEEAERRGAVGALIIHTTDAAGYPWGVVQSSWTGEQFMLPPAAAEPPALDLRGWVTYDFAREALAVVGLDLDELYVRAARSDFAPVPTGLRVAARVPARSRRVDTHNVIGVVPGRGPRAAEHVIYTAHYDHLGIGPAVDGDSIYNGAYDNASGIALLLELAEAFARLRPAPARSVVFVATGAEEAGLLGAQRYVREPALPLGGAVATINIDGANVWGETDDVVGLGADRSTLGPMLQRRAREMGLVMETDLAPEKGLFFRSDHFAFARAGVPALSLEHGSDFRGRPPGWGDRVLRLYDAERYHRPGDEYSAAFVLEGAVQQAKLAFLLGYDLASMEGRPSWYPGSGFRAAQERLRARRR